MHCENLVSQLIDRRGIWL